MDPKNIQTTVSDELGVENDEKYGTVRDVQDMDRMGKLQQLRRNFTFLTMWGYAMLVGCSWEFSLIGAIFSLPNGGTGGAIWMYFIVAVLFFCVVLSLAEMASISPTAGAQYHWVSQFAPASFQKPLSFCVGWFVVIAWQTGLAACSFTVGLQIEAIIVLADPSYVIRGWHSCLFTIAAALLGILFNTYLVRRLPTVEGIATVLHVLGFFAFLVVFWVMGPRADAKTVFTSFEDNNGWGSVGLATLVGILSPISCLILGDSACHLSEELRDAGKVLPRSMIATAVVNYIFGFLMTVTLMFVVGDVTLAFESPTGQPYVQTVLNTTGSTGATITLTAVIAILVQFSAINTVTSSSRQIFAFARDGGLPFSDFLSTVSAGSDIPLPAICVTCASVVLLSLIVIGSTTAFNILLSLESVALLCSYLVPIICVITKRIKGERLPPSSFSLGAAGLVINLLAAAFLILGAVMLFFPGAPHPTPQTMNWSSLIFFATLMFSWVYYFFVGKNKYVAPVELMKQE